MIALSQETARSAAKELESLGAEPISRETAAQAARARFKPGVITYSRKVFLPLTNLCRDYCGYCTFRRDPDHHPRTPKAGVPGTPDHQAGAHTMTPDEVMEVVRAGERRGCTEALFSLGDKPELLFPEMRETLRHLGYKSTLHYLEAMCERVLRESSLLPHPNPGLMSAEWLERLARVAPSMGLMLETTSTRLLAKGAAHDNAPDKDPARRLRVIEEAGRQKIPFTTGILIGIGETMEERVDTLAAIRELHEKYGHIQEVIVQNFRAKAGTPMAAWPEPDSHNMLRTLAVARLMMPAMNIQAPPNLSEPDYAELLDGRISTSCANARRPKAFSCSSGCRFILNSLHGPRRKANCSGSGFGRTLSIHRWEERHDHRFDRRHGRRKVCGRTAADRAPGRFDHRRQHGR